MLTSGFGTSIAPARLWTLRDELSLTGTRFGCGMALCGACTVHLDGQAVRSCVTPISAAANKRVVTIEGVGTVFGLLGYYLGHAAIDMLRAYGFIGAVIIIVVAGVLISMRSWLRRRLERGET